MDVISGLNNYSMVSLRKIANYYGINFTPDMKKEELIEKVGKMITIEVRVANSPFGIIGPPEEKKYSLRVERIRQSMIE